jgi:hypothetical protein
MAKTSCLYFQLDKAANSKDIGLPASQAATGSGEMTSALEPPRL